MNTKITLINQILSAKKENPATDTSALEREIDGLVYGLYGLTEEEIGIRLLNFIDSDKYQIFIMGHSCGLSDRTLLNKLFEHDNCVSIKVFYHQIDETTDNYSDIVRNISRNFTSKAVMREKVVNKMYSKSLS